MTKEDAFALFKDYADGLLEIGEDFANSTEKIDTDEVFFELQAFFSNALDGLKFVQTYYK